MKLEICMASDDAYCVHLGICLISLLENNAQNEINLHILNNNISENNLIKLNKILEDYSNLKLNFYDINEFFKGNDTAEFIDNTLKDNEFYQLLGINTFLRLFLTEILPENIDKIIYLDCDMVVLDDLSSLYNINIKENYCAGCIESNISRYFYLGSELKNPFINAGLLLINLKKWRETDFIEKMIKLIKEYPIKNFLNDQNIINILSQDKNKIINPKYNMISQNYYVNYQKTLKINDYFGSIDKYCNESEMKIAMKNPTIVHFSSQVWHRPWITNNLLFNHPVKNPFNEKYHYYKSISPWKDEKLISSNKSISTKIYYEILRFIMIYAPYPFIILLYFIKMKIK